MNCLLFYSKHFYGKQSSFLFYDVYIYKMYPFYSNQNIRLVLDALVYPLYFVG